MHANYQFRRHIQRPSLQKKKNAAQAAGLSLLNLLHKKTNKQKKESVSNPNQILSAYRKKKSVVTQCLWLKKSNSSCLQLHQKSPSNIHASKPNKSYVINKVTLPAHDFMSEQNSAHFRILVLSFISYGLKMKKSNINSIRVLLAGDNIQISGEDFLPLS